MYSHEIRVEMVKQRVRELKRLTRARAEIASAANYDEHLVNVEVGPCAESLYTIIQYHIQYGQE